ncbi:hypothetical protein Tco_0192346, partial [Tanacetum coccineum]
MTTNSYVSSTSQNDEYQDGDGKDAPNQPSSEPQEDPSDGLGSFNQELKDGDDADITNSINRLSTASPSVSTTGFKSMNLQSSFDEVFLSTPISVHGLENTGIFDDAYDDRGEGEEADINNLDSQILVSLIPSSRIHKDHPKDQILGEVHSAVQTRSMLNQNEAGLVTYINKQRRTNHKDFQNCLFACFLSQSEPKKITQALEDESWVEAMQEELLQFQLQQVWTLVDLPNGKRAIGSKWVYRNK